MKVNMALGFLGTVAVSAIVLPAQAATVHRTTVNVGGTITTAAYQITGLDVSGTLYTVDFDHGEFTTVFPATSTQYFGGLADQVREAIVSALNGQGIGSVVERLTIGTAATPATYGQDILSQFEIPIAVGQNNGENSLAICNVGGAFNAACASEPRGINGPLMYAKFTATGSTTVPTTGPTTGPNPSIPTPALIPGLLGMGLTAMRKQQRAA